MVVLTISKGSCKRGGSQYYVIKTSVELSRFCLVVFSGPPEKKMGIKASNTAEVSALKTALKFYPRFTAVFMYSNDKVRVRRETVLQLVIRASCSSHLLAQ